jgi:hypothetical protein
MQRGSPPVKAKPAHGLWLSKGKNAGVNPDGHGENRPRKARKEPKANAEYGVYASHAAEGPR